MNFKMSAKTDVGRQRVRNEDNYLILEKFGLSAVADGMGGHIDGNIASQIAVDTIKVIYEKNYENLLKKEFESIEKKIKEHEIFLSNVVQEANKNIFNRNKTNFSIEGMGTTIVVLQVIDDYILTASVGDSRIYRFRDENLERLTQDHSLVEELVRYNIISEKDLIFFQNKNIITRALGMSEKVLIDINSHKISPNDIYLLCSDGLTDSVKDEEIKEILIKYSNNIDECVDELIKRANELGGQDNITVSLVHIL